MSPARAPPPSTASWRPCAKRSACTAKPPSGVAETLRDTAQQQAAPAPHDALTAAPDIAARPDGDERDIWV
ncbi:hypothetical protein ACFVZ3_10075 [Kitasatospora purpeofusca]|uniref:hypothetical protein n=1 Tax=Kitasatospora purpeofusca TaxID=67352 RepID=UPI003676029A